MKKWFLCVLCLFLGGCLSKTESSETCGDMVVDPGEECDGYNHGGLFCQELGYYGGVLSCNDDCTLDISRCLPYGRCGDQTVQPLNESCDGTDMADTL
ncbi:hypothetical protein KJ865_10550, partial [Myxococcota bacterium]|nr:hypothetical protein [Myxococcota bacterium]